MRQGAFAHNMKIPTLKVYGTKASIDKIPENYKNISLNTIDLFETVKIDGYEITALPARHMARGVSVIYIIKGDKTILYAHDTGFLFDEVLDYFKDNKIYFDMVTLDCTNGAIVPITDEGGHMGFDNLNRLLKRLEEIGAIDSKTIKYFNHFSHNVNPLQEELEKVADTLGAKISYDGLEVEV
jgi:phosphoribosyl 1,2-cyclic phosphate phosphodiesterase